MSDDNDTKLPKVPSKHDPMWGIEQYRRQRDGMLSVSNADTIEEADDIGDVQHCPNPRASDLDYVTGCDMQHSSEQTPEGGLRNFLHDGPNVFIAGETYISASDDAFIDDLSEWA